MLKNMHQMQNLLRNTQKHPSHQAMFLRGFIIFSQEIYIASKSQSNKTHKLLKDPTFVRSFFFSVNILFLNFHQTLNIFHLNFISTSSEIIPSGEPMAHSTCDNNQFPIFLNLPILFLFKFISYKIDYSKFLTYNTNHYKITRKERIKLCLK